MLEESLLMAVKPSYSIEQTVSLQHICMSYDLLIWKEENIKIHNSS